MHEVGRDLAGAGRLGEMERGNVQMVGRCLHGKGERRVKEVVAKTAGSYGVLTCLMTGAAGRSHWP